MKWRLKGEYLDLRFLQRFEAPTSDFGAGTGKGRKSFSVMAGRSDSRSTKLLPIIDLRFFLAS